MDTAICPRCGAENPADAMNCAACRINLKYAHENPAEIERLRQQDVLSGRLRNGAWVADAAPVHAPREEPVLLPVLLLFSSFAFAYILGTAVHEIGHYLAHRAYGYEVRVVLHPFSGAMTLGSSSPQEILGVTSAAGPLFNLLVAIGVFLLLWRRRRPALLPLLLWGPLALVQEGVAFSLGMLTPGGDADLIVRAGFPAFILLALGILLLASGVTMLCGVLPLAGLSPDDSLWRKFTLVTGGMASFMLVRFLYASLFRPEFVQANAVSLIFALLLAAIVVMLYAPLQPLLRRVSENRPADVTESAVAWSAGMALGMILLQLSTFN